MFAVILVGVLNFPTIVLAGGNRYAITCNELLNEVTIDGRWTYKDEWGDSSRHSLFFTKGGEGDLRVKEDDNFLYALIDYFADLKRQKGDFAGMIIDQRNDFGDEPQTDDFMLICQWSSDLEHTAGALKWRGGEPRGLNWRDVIQLPSGVEISSSDDASNDPVAKEPHMIYEFKIPRNLVGYPSIGFVVFTGDGEMGRATSTWPPARLERNLFDDPSQWGELIFPTPPKQIALTQTTAINLERTYIPGGYITIVGIIIVVVAATAGLILRKRKR